ncbi:unnamed protein product [Nippostrongylus brasiliensis]|uniref:t-SNARE coiled-coil homology domain-containing protein n=1 Tax=Nippostrongylus brasiliensis TaxID=27835 RepID=A0A0N4XRU5_NIPBR|nr:unnamed protein product [Nippostrongylus brasiliensis]
MCLDFFTTNAIFKSLQDRNAAFEETKQFALQSLASVAYQINTLARDLLDMLDLQTDKISNLTGQVENIDVVVNIHKEKLARREIGALTTNKTLQKQPKIIAPAAQEPTQRYRRVPIDFSVLDGIGHGVRCEVSIQKNNFVKKCYFDVLATTTPYCRGVSCCFKCFGHAAVLYALYAVRTHCQYRKQYG